MNIPSLAFLCSAIRRIANPSSHVRHRCWPSCRLSCRALGCTSGYNTAVCLFVLQSSSLTTFSLAHHLYSSSSSFTFKHIVHAHVCCECARVSSTTDCWRMREVSDGSSEFPISHIGGL